MTERPPGSGPPEEGTPEYDWLYGSGGAAPGKHRTASEAPDGAPDDATRQVPQQERPEETRIMPATPPSQSKVSASARDIRRQRAQRAERDEPRATRPTPPPVAPPPGASRGDRRFRFRFRYVWLLLLLWLVFLVVVPLIAWNKVSKIDAEPGVVRPGDQPGSTYLLVGSDSRADLSEEERKELNTGNAGGGRTDTIMLLHTGNGPDVLMSIPRDSQVTIPGHGTNKINAAYAFGGPKLLVRTIEQNTGIRIDDYVEIGFGGFVDLVDAVGGIEICPKEDMVDADANLSIKKGCQDADGEVALAYARSRHAQQLGDLDRTAHQREVVSAIGDAALSPWTFINPVRYWNTSMAVPGAVAVSEGTGPFSVAQALLAVSRLDSGGLTCGTPITDGSAEHWDQERAEALFQKIIEDDTSGIGKRLCTPSGLVAN
jgi:LCP family protein required for cell wall assembly